ncbi:MAG: crosslink repair DNA glycosylase YcaQ family protein, partial [Trueperaceae bacterium]
PLRLAAADAAAASLRYHFAPTDLAGAFARHASVQLDPLAPLAPNHDLVLAARVSDYRQGDGDAFVYEQRGAYDGWDKQASWVETRGLPARRWLQRRHGERWRPVLSEHPKETRAFLDELRERGPSEPSELAVDRSVDAWRGSWYGPRLAKRLARALWHAGTIATHHRRHGRHVYDLAERVHPREVLDAPDPDPSDAVRQVLLDRHRATGLLRPNAPAEVWSLPLAAHARKAALQELVADGRLRRVEVDGTVFHAVPAWTDALDRRDGHGVRFVAPLDPLIWDRPAAKTVFGFDYLWEVYKPAAKRRWGYYVLPVADQAGLVARAEIVRDRATRTPRLYVRRWWWEPERAPAEGSAARTRFLERLEHAIARLARLVEVRRAVASRTVPSDVRSAFRAGADAT